MRLKLEAIRDVHIRKGAASINSQSIGYITKGAVLDIELEIIPNGDKLQLNNTGAYSSKWYKDGNGHFLWSGGFREIVDTPIELTTTLIDYNLELVGYLKNEDLRRTKGSGVKIAIIDDFGFATKHNGKNLNYIPKNLISVTHGFKTASIIGGNDDDICQFHGIAPSSEIYVYDYAGSVVGVKNALKSILESNRVIDIVCLAFDASRDIEFDKLTNDILDRNILVIAAAGDDNEIKIAKLYYPALMERVVGIGTISDNIHIPAINMPNIQDLIITPNVEYPIKINGQNTSFILSSAATAYLTGIAALYKSYYGVATKDSFIEFIKSKSRDISSINYNKTKFTSYTLNQLS